MFGFILSMENSSESSIPKTFGVPRHIDVPASLLSIGNSVSFVGWGDSSGDVHFSQTNDHSLLIMVGYISKANGIGDFHTQQEACDLLLNSFDHKHSIEFCSLLADQIYGSFAIIYVNLPGRKIYCISDRISSRPIWIKQTQEGWIVSSHSNAIAFINNTIEYDLGALGAFLLYGNPVDPAKSIYKGINAILQGSVQILNMDKTITTHRWYRFRHNPDRTLSYKAWIDIASRCLRESATRILNQCSNPMIFFSGGVDSRLTASSLRAVGGEPLLVTLGDSENLEINVAKKAAKALQCKHEIIIRDKHWYLRSLPKVVYEAGGSFVWTHGHFSQAYRETRDKYGIDSAFLGDFCEAFSKLLCVVDQNRLETWTEQEFIEEFDNLALSLYRPRHRELTLSLIERDVRHEMERQLQQDIVERYNLLCDVSDDPVIVADHFFRWQSAPTIATFLMFLDLRSVGPERSIMFDKDVHHLLEILPGVMRDGANMGARLIQKLWPPAAKVINSNSRLPLAWPTKMHTTAISMRPVIRKMRKRILGNTYKTTSSWPKKAQLYKTDPRWFSFFNKILLNSSLFSKDIFDYNKIENCWHSFCNGDMNLARDIEKLIQIGLQNLYAKRERDLIRDDLTIS